MLLLQPFPVLEFHFGGSPFALKTHERPVTLSAPLAVSCKGVGGPWLDPLKSPHGR